MDMSEGKKRHGCLAAYLWVMIVLNSIVAIFYLFGSAAIREISRSIPDWALPVLAIGAILNVVFAIALYQWKMWGFLGFVATSVLVVVVNLMIGIGVIQALLGLGGVAVLYGVLQIGDKEEAAISLNLRSVLPSLPPGATPEQIAYQKQLEEREKALRAHPKGWSQLE
jgi:mannose/fructose/N-acetylgalactosamine-specific phosphotransferase system component IIC